MREFGREGERERVSLNDPVIMANLMLTVNWLKSERVLSIWYEHAA